MREPPRSLHGPAPADPVRGGSTRPAPRETMSDDLLERVRARARDNAFWRYLGVEVAEASEGRVRLLVRARDDIRNAPGAPVHGGVFSAPGDMAGGAPAPPPRAGPAGGGRQATPAPDTSVAAAG